MTRTCLRHLPAAFFLCFFTALCGCGKQNTEEPDTQSHSAYEAGQTSVLAAESPGTVTAGSDSLVLDFSNAVQGYFTGTLSSEDTKINIQVI